MEILKEDGIKKRKLGIPTTVDRVIQQSIAQILSPMNEIQFSDNSYGFRPKRSAMRSMDNTVSFVEKKLFLKVNTEKTKVDLVMEVKVSWIFIL